MKDQIKNIFVFLIVFITITISFMIPKLLMKIEDINMENKIFSKTKMRNKIDIQAEKIYLVQALHQLHDGSMNMRISKKEKIYYEKDKYTQVETSTKGNGTEIVQASSEDGKELSEKNINHIKSEISKLEKSDILKHINLEDDNTKYSLEFFTTTYSDNKSEYEFIIKYYELQGDDYKIGIEIEEKTGKIIFIHVPENKIKLEIERKGFLENYIKYLDLYIIDDWKLENNNFKSEKAQLTATILDGNNGEYILTIQPISRIKEYNEILQ